MLENNCISVHEELYQEWEQIEKEEWFDETNNFEDELFNMFNEDNLGDFEELEIKWTFEKFTNRKNKENTHVKMTSPEKKQKHKIYTTADFWR
jgi:F0F1-type ATP synthase gamma subunit